MAPVTLYVYDLSNGLARSLSLPLTGRQIDIIAHTSVVVFGREVYFGQGIQESRPGATHHGAPLQQLDMGDTSLDEETFNEYLDGLRDHYRADKYHLLDFNCNSFTADVVGFLTGATIPASISSLPADFLSTPFGAALRPQIDAMFNPAATSSRPTASSLTSAAASSSPNPALAANLLSAFASAAQQPTPPASNPSTLTSPLQLASNPASFHAILNGNKATIAFFTNPTSCPPCRVAEPIFERIAREKAREGVAFVTVDLGVGKGGEVAQEWGVRVTPSVMFFRGEGKVDELKGAEEREMRSKTEFLVHEAFPPHPHSTLPLRSIQAVSSQPILFTQPPNYLLLLAKLTSFLAPTPHASASTFFSSQLVPFLEKKTLPAGVGLAGLLETFVGWTKTLAAALKKEEMFPVVDLWRVALLDPKVSSWCAVQGSQSGASPLSLTISLLSSSKVLELPRPLLLTSLRLLSNAFSSLALASALISASSPSRSALTSIVIDALLAEDAALRSAAAALAFDIAGVRHRRSAARMTEAGEGESEEEGDWVGELVFAVVEAIRVEAKSEDVVYRLLSALALFLFLSPHHASALGPNLEAVGARDVLLEKLSWVTKREVRGLVEDLGRLCA